MDSFLEKRAEFAKSNGFYEHLSNIDHFNLFIGEHNFARMIFMIEILNQTKSIPGDMAELGIFRGSNSILMAKYAKMFNTEKKLYCFDNFSGLPAPSTKDLNNYLVGKYKGNRDFFEGVLGIHDLINYVEIHEGSIETTVPNFVRKNKSIFSLIYFDADLYEPAKTMYDFLSTRISIGGIILLDEYGFPEWLGETKATDDFIQSNPNFELHYTPEYVHQPSAIIIRKF